jgi:hypothetical protein
MSLRPLRLAAAAALVVFAASACTTPLGPDEASADINTTTIDPLSGEHQGSDSVRGIDAAPQHTEHQGSDS